jgi:hypothetical protein
VAGPLVRDEAQGAVRAGIYKDDLDVLRLLRSADTDVLAAALEKLTQHPDAVGRSARDRSVSRPRSFASPLRSLIKVDGDI